MLSSHTVGFQRPDNSNLANLTPAVGVQYARICDLFRFRLDKSVCDEN